MAYDSTYSSPHWKQRSGKPINLLVVHASASSIRNSLRWLLDPVSQLSVHYIIDKGGRVFQLVPEEYAARHTSCCRWQSCDELDDSSIAIELENANSGADPYPDAQVAALFSLAGELIDRYRLKPEQLVRHADIAQPPGRKSDPAGFPWERFKAHLFSFSLSGASKPYPLPPSLFEELGETLREVAYREAGVAYRPTWAFFRQAVLLGLGSPLLESFQATLAGQIYLVQPFAHDVLLCPLGDWERIQRLSELPSQSEGLRLELLEQLYARCGGAYQAESPFHRHAQRESLSAPLMPLFELSAGGVEWLSELYAADSLFAPAITWHDVRRLGDLTRGMYDRRPPQLSDRDQALRAELLALLHRRVCGEFYREWPFQQKALSWELGSPLGRPVRCSHAGRDYLVQPYGLDVLFCPIGEWAQADRASRV